MKQYQVFAANEADNYFIRNKEHLISTQEDSDFCFQTIKKFLPLEQIHSVIELGAANGYRLNFFKKHLPNCSKFVGTELSPRAVKDGIERYGIEMYHGAIEDFVPETPFDLVIVQSVLHWVDRDNLYKTLYNIDKMVAENGFLVIGDFDPFYPYKNLYHHVTSEQLYTFKQDYSQLFLASNCYQLFQKIYYYETYTPHDNLYTYIDKTLTHNERRSIAVMHKNSLKYYG